MKKILKRLLIVATMTMMALACVVLVGCKEELGAKTITNLRYDGENIRWTRVIKAKHYLLSVNGQENVTVNQVEGETVAYAIRTMDDFSLTLEAVVKEGDEDNPKITLDFVNIGTVEGVKVEDAKLQWDALDGADGYELMKNGILVNQTVGVNEYALESGAFSYKVRAVKGTTSAVDGNNGYYSVWSEAVTGTVLEAPKNLKYDSETFTWDRVNHAVSYTIAIGNDEFTTTQTEYEYTGSDDFFVCIRANGDAEEDYYASPFTAKKECVYLDPVTTLTVKDGNLDWENTENATGYKIRIDGMLQEQILRDSIYENLQSGRSYQISVLPVGNGDFTFSQWSNTVTINVLAQPVVMYNGSAIGWTAVTNAGGYTILITKNGEEVHKQTVGSGIHVYGEYGFTDAGVYQVSVKANGDTESGHYDSRYSNPYAVRRLSAPESITVANRLEETAQVALSYSPVPNAASYTVKINGTDTFVNVNDTTVEVNIANLTSTLTQSEVTFSVVANGTVTTEGATLGSAETSKTVTKLAAPQNVQINDGEISWNAVTAAESYVVTIDANRFMTTGTSFTPDWTAGAHTVRVQAGGNGTDVISSSFTEEKSVTKLNAPTNLSINAEGRLTWNRGNTVGVSAFVVQFDKGNPISVNEDSFDIQSYVNNVNAGVWTELTVYAAGDGSNYISSDYSETGGIYKYVVPTNLATNGNTLIWSEPTYNGTTPSKYELVIMKGGEVFKTTTVTSNSYVIGTEFDAGAYSFTVKALGDKFASGTAVSTWDSASSASVSFQKLEQVNVTKSGNTYTWQPVIGATAYTVQIGNNPATTVTTTSYELNVATAGEFNVLITAKGNSSANILDSDTVTISQRVRALTTPVVISATGGVLTMEKPSDFSGITGFNVIIGGVSNFVSIANCTVTETQILINYTASSSATVQVSAVGGIFGADGVFYVNSQLSQEV